MRNQRLPPLNYPELAQAIIDSKRGSKKDRLRALSGLIQQRFILYTRGRATIRSIGAIAHDGDDKEALSACYDSDTAALKALKRKMIRSLNREATINLSQCPYCLVREPGSWDHYLPKSKFPEFSVYGENLIYICERCNRVKGDEYLGTDKLIINSYFDVLPEVPLLRAEISIRNRSPAVRFYVESPGAAHDELAALMLSHFNRLGLRRLYRKESNSFISSFMTEMAMRYRGRVSPEIYTQELRFRFNSIPRAWGVNHWQAVLVTAMHECADIIEVINAMDVTEDNDEWRRE